MPRVKDDARRNPAGKGPLLAVAARLNAAHKRFDGFDEFVAVGPLSARLLRSDLLDR
jgi:hypothetical protein